MNFLYPWVLALIPVYLLLEVISFYRAKSTVMSLPNAGFIRIFPTWRTTAVRILRFLPPAVIVLVIIAAASPQSTDVRKQFLPSGIDIMIVLDTSGSMAAEDFQPLNRLEGAKSVLRDFVKARPSDRIGLVLFSGRSVTRSPLTLQHDTLIRTLDSTKMGALPDGTAIGTAIMSGINRLAGRNPDSESGARIMLLITDGRNNGEIHPLDAVNAATNLGIKIYTVGVGGFGPAPYPIIEPDGKKSYRYEKADLDENLLVQIALKTGGKYFRASDPQSLAGLFQQINTLEKSAPRTIESRSILPRSSLPAMPALFIALCYIILTTIIVRLP